MKHTVPQGEDIVDTGAAFREHEDIPCTRSVKLRSPEISPKRTLEAQKQQKGELFGDAVSKKNVIKQ
jgi:hypothetical protein